MTEVNMSSEWTFKDQDCISIYDIAIKVKDKNYFQVDGSVFTYQQLDIMIDALNNIKEMMANERNGTNIDEGSSKDGSNRSTSRSFDCDPIGSFPCGQD